MPAAQPDDYGPVPSGGGVYAGATTGMPAWRIGQAVGQWREIIGSALGALTPTATATTVAGGAAILGASSRMNAWCGLCIDPRSSKVYSAANGGHGDYYGNEVCSIDLTDDDPAWVELLAGSSGNVVKSTEQLPDATSRGYAQYTDGRPCSRHSYSGQQFITAHERVLTLGGSTSPRGSFFENVESFSVLTNSWDAYDCTADPPPYGYALGGTNNGWTPSSAWSTCTDPRDSCVYVVTQGSLRRFTPGETAPGGTWDVLADSPWAPDPYPGSYAVMAVDVNRNHLVWMLGNGAHQIYSFDLTAQTWAEGQSFPASAAATAMLSTPAMIDPGGPAFGSAGGVFVPEIDAFLIRMAAAGGTVYRVDAATFGVAELSTEDGASVPDAAAFSDQQGVFTRWLYAPGLGGVVYFPNHGANGWFLRTH